ncbi:MAG: hypothetical protein ACJ75F_12840 [Flavisolibacter sp.]
MKSTEAYKNYKFLSALQPVSNQSVRTDISSKSDVHFRHSGNAGDIIYSLPAIKTLAEGRNIHLHLNLNQPRLGKMYHPLGNVMLNEQMVSMLQPLLLEQPYIQSCDTYKDQQVDFDMDIFRQYPFNYRMHSIARWYFLAFGISSDLGKPWLHVTPNDHFKDAIVIARSHRYHAPGIDYSFLKRYPRTVFVGLQNELEEMRKMIPTIEYYPVKDFLELASVINGSRFFIGNQSFPFSLAEALKCKRLLEVYHISPNVIVEGAYGFDFCYQPQFEKLAEKLYEGF